MFKEDIRIAINLCISKGIPFVAYQLPHENSISFFSNPNPNPNPNKTINYTKFSIGFFADKLKNPINIYNELNAKETILYCSRNNYNYTCNIIPYHTSTNYKSYESNLNNLIDKLKHTNGKVVISKVICQKHNISDWARIAYEYFSIYNICFRYIYFTPETGCWIGASPEIIIEKDYSTNILQSMSLAGTRRKDKFQLSWDNKNIEEHNYVTNHISETVKKLGYNIIIHNYENLPFGNIEHLCNRIEIQETKKSSLSPLELVIALTPTPALAGYPTNDALNLIKQIEAHPRYCYGGYLTIDNGDTFRSFVNLRCAHFDKSSYCIYSGGGITKDSIAINEWDETEHKIHKLKELLS